MSAPVPHGGDDGGVDRPSQSDVAMDAVTFGVALDAMRPNQILTPPGSGNTPPPRCPNCEHFLHPVRTDEHANILFECMTDHEAVGLTRMGYECVYDRGLQGFRVPAKLPWCRVEVNVETGEVRVTDLGLWVAPLMPGQQKDAPKAKAAKRDRPATAQPAASAAPSITEEQRAALKTLGMTEADYLAKLNTQGGQATTVAAATTSADAPRTAKKRKAIAKKRLGKVTTAAGEPPASAPDFVAASAPAFLSLRAAATLSGVARSTLMAMIARGELTGAHRADTGWEIPRPVVLELRESRTKT